MVTLSVTIEKYIYAALIDADYEIPSATGIPWENGTSYDRISIAWDEPQDGASNVRHYEVESFLLSDNTDGQNCTEPVWKKLGPLNTRGKEERIEMTGLKPERIYVFTIYTLSEHGKTAVSQKSDFIQTAKCPRGMYNSNVKCLPCSPGYFSETEGAIACEKCQIGSRSIRGSSRCQPCQTGTYLQENQCLPCNPGSFSSVPGSLSCQICPIGFYADAYGSTKCQKCPNGTATVLPGGKDINECGSGINNIVYIC